MTLKHPVAVALVGVALMAGGCGSSSKTTKTASTTTSTTTGAGSTATFNTGFKTITGQLQQTAGAIAMAIQAAPSQTGTQLAATFGGLAKRWSGVAGQLSALTPPASVSSEFSALKASANRTSADLVAVSGAAAKNNAVAAKQAVVTMLRDILAAKAAATKIDARLRIT